MWRYFISIIFVAASGICKLQAQDTVVFPLKLRVGFDVVGASKYFYEKERANLEFYFSADLDEKKSVILFTGISDYTYLRYRDETFIMYNLNSKGFYTKAGIDFNMVNIKKAAGKYFIGVGFRYGISNYSYNVSEINMENNYWGRYQTFIPPQKTWGHFFEAAPTTRVEVLKNLSLGWSLSIRKLLSAGTEKELKPLYLPGYGDGSKSFNFAINYFITWNIPYKEKKAIVFPRFSEPEEEY